MALEKNSQRAIVERCREMQEVWTSLRVSSGQKRIRELEKELQNEHNKD